LAAYIASRVNGFEEARLFLGVGILGGFTTFSAFSLEAIMMLERKAYGVMASYITASVIGSGQSVRVPPLPDPTEAKTKETIHPADVNYMRALVIYEDEDLIAINKPAGLAVQGGTKTFRHIDGLLPALGEGCRLIHRLDRDTSGVLLIAKNARVAAWAGRAFQGRRAEKIYWGVTNGVPRPLAFDGPHASITPSYAALGRTYGRGS